MLTHLSIRQKMLLLILGIALLTYASGVAYVGWYVSQKAVTDAKKLADLGAREKANKIQSDFEGYLSLSRAMAKIVEDYPQKSSLQRLEQERELLRKVQESNPDLKQVWMSWEMKALDPDWDKDFGRERHAFTLKKDGNRVEFLDTADIETHDPENFYYVIRSSQKEGAAEPYYFAPNRWPGVLGTSIVTPIKKGSQYLGQVGFDFATSKYMSTTSFDAFKRSYAIVISDRGQIVAHPDENLINQYVDQISYIRDRDPSDLRARLANGQALTLEDTDDYLSERVYVNLRSVPIGRSGTFWTIGTVVPFAEITKDARVIIRNATIIGIGGFLLLLIVITNITGNIVRSLRKSESLLRKLAQGEVNQEALDIRGTDELSRISQSVNLLLSDLAQKASFAEEIGRGNLESQFQVSGRNDQLGASLIKMRDNLLGVIHDVEEVVSAATIEGDLSARVTTEEKLGVWQALAISINDLIASFYAPLQSISSLADLIAKGDLSQRLDEELSGDLGELSVNLNQGLQNLAILLSNVIDQVKEIQTSASDMLLSGEEMNVSTSEIAQAIQEMNNGATSQVHKADESSSLIEKIMQNSTKMEFQAQEINTSADSSSEKSASGLERINNVDATMKEISQFSKKTNGSFQVLMGRFQEISKSLEVITEISSQTNLLAVNAAIEAAQAGDAGRGFAVVADEIRKLAEGSRKSASEINELVEAVSFDTSEASEVLTSMNKRIAAGEKASQEASDAFQEIATATGQTLALAKEIYEASIAQKSDIKEVVGITESVVVIAEETAAGTEEVSTSASQLAAGMEEYKKQSQSLGSISLLLKSAIERFKLKNDNG